MEFREAKGGVVADGLLALQAGDSDHRFQSAENQAAMYKYSPRTVAQKIVSIFLVQHDCCKLHDFLFLYSFMPSASLRTSFPFQTPNCARGSCRYFDLGKAPCRKER